MRKTLNSTTIILLLSVVGLLVPMGFLVNDEVVFPLLWNVAGGEADPLFAAQLVDYIEGKADAPAVLTGAEWEHMEDVKDVFSLAQCFLGYIVALLLMFFVEGKCDWVKVLSVVRWVWLGVPVLVVVLFPFTFTWSHQLLFRAGSWIFDPATTTLVNVFTTEFFVGIGVLWLFCCWVLAALAQSTLLLSLKNRKL